MRKTWDAVEVKFEEKGVACWYSFLRENIVLIDDFDARIAGIEPVWCLTRSDNVDITSEPGKTLFKRAKRVAKFVDVVVVSCFCCLRTELRLERKVFWVRTVDPGGLLIMTNPMMRPMTYQV